MDIYRTDLDIPEKPRHIGWLMVAAGLIMIAIAVVAYFRLTAKLAELEPHQIEPPAAKVMAVAEVDQDREVRRARILAWATILLLGTLFTLILVATVSHRFGMRIRAQAEQKRRKTTWSDPWQEAGQRITVPPDDTP